MDKEKWRGVSSWLPQYTEEYIPDLVHDFLLENWNLIREVMEDE